MGRAQHAACARDERKKSERLNGFLAIELLTAECFFSAVSHANAESVAAYMADLATHFAAGGYQKVSIFLDRNSTHLTKMKDAYAGLTSGLAIEMRFIHFAPYSPALNPVEYLIHWIRQHSLHHADCKQTLAEVKQRLTSLLDHQIVLSQDQLVNILSHIEQLVVAKQKPAFSP